MNYFKKEKTIQIISKKEQNDKIASSTNSLYQKVQ
jgi:hypothetical protein